MVPMVVFLRRLGHRVFSYQDDSSETAKASRPGRAAGVGDVVYLGRFMITLFDNLGRTLHTYKSFFGGATRLKILRILIETEEQRFILSPNKLSAIEKSASRRIQ